MTPDKTDNNQSEIVKALRKIPGVTVEVGHDDILVGHRRKTYWFEIKDTSVISKKTGKPYKNAIKPSQEKLLATFTGHYAIAWEIGQILVEMGFASTSYYYKLSCKEA